MLTIEKIKIYNKFGGDIDGLARVGKSTKKNLISDNDWSLINEFEQDVKLILSLETILTLRREVF